LSTYREYEPAPPPESDLSQIEAYDRGLTSDPGCWTQPVELRKPEREFDSEEADRYEAWVDGLYEAHCGELGLDPDTGEPPRYAGPPGSRNGNPGPRPGDPEAGR